MAPGWLPLRAIRASMANHGDAAFWQGNLMLTIIYSVSTWALEEARRRLEQEGILPDPTKQEKKD